MTDKVKILIVEDEFIVAEDIRVNPEKLGYEVSDIAANGEDAIQRFEEQKPDLVLMDIHLDNGMDGIAAAGKIRQQSEVPLIYLTAHSDQSTFDRAKNTEPNAYIVKPFNFHNLHSAIELALHNFSRKAFGHPGELAQMIQNGVKTPSQFFFNETIFIKFGKAFQKIRLSDICYVKADGSYSVIHTSKRDFTLAMNLHTFLERLQRPGFLRIHRSYIVNLDCIDRIEESGIQVKGEFIPVSRSSREELLNRLNSL